MVITAVTDELVPQVMEFLRSRKEFGFSQDWHGVFNYRWKQENFPYGYAIVHEGQVLGFLGTLFCERVIGETSLVYCNLSVWVVDDSRKGARSLALALLAPALKIKNILITCFTANEKGLNGLKKVGFKSIDDRQIALPTLTSYLAWPANGSFEAIFDMETIARYLDEKDTRILSDHKHLDCSHFLLRDKITDQYCYVVGVMSPFRLRSVPWPVGALLQRVLSGYWCFNICYSSAPRLLAQNIQFVNRSLWKHRNVLALRYDSRLVPQRLSFWEYKKPTVRLGFGSVDLQTQNIDALYSELVTYNIY